MVSLSWEASSGFPKLHMLWGNIPPSCLPEPLFLQDAVTSAFTNSPHVVLAWKCSSLRTRPKWWWCAFPVIAVRPPLLPFAPADRSHCFGKINLLGNEPGGCAFTLSSAVCVPSSPVFAIITCDSGASKNPQTPSNPSLP